MKTQPTILMDVLRRFTEEHPQHQERIERILQKIIGQLETEQTQEEKT